MTECLIILISSILIWCVERQRIQISRLRKPITIPAPRVDYSRINGKLEQVYRRAAIAEKLAERSFNLASSATLGVMGLQKTLALPRVASKPMLQRNLLAKNEIDKLFTTNGSFDFLRSELSDEELDVLDKLEDQKLKDGSN